eukprot:2373813-Pyramimonas_sp.AAC.1
MMYDDLQWMWTCIDGGHGLHPTVDLDPALSASRVKPQVSTAQVEAATQRHMRCNLDPGRNNLLSYQDSGLVPRVTTDDTFNDKTT